MKPIVARILFVCSICLFLLGCGGAENDAVVTTEPSTETAISNTTAPTETRPVPTATTAPPTITSEPPPDATETAAVPTETAVPPTATPLPPLPPDPQPIEFQTEDGVTLAGTYYPAAVNPAPVVVLMHWAGGDQTDWQYVGMAAWLQNRGLDVPAAPGAKAFDTPYAFPPLPENQSYAVFTFDFRGYGESGADKNQEDHVLDARAAYATARELPGIDPERVVGIGASIGSDAVVDGCTGDCQAALSLSPGSYLGVTYADAVTVVDDLGKPVWCVAAEDDETAVATCQSASGEQYQTTIYPNGGHAMALFRVENNLEPPIENVILDFLQHVFE